MDTSPSNEELYSKVQTLSDGSRRIPECPVKTVEVSHLNSESLSMPNKTIISPSKKIQSKPIQQSFKNSQQPYTSQQQNTQMVIYYYF